MYREPGDVADAAGPAPRAARRPHAARHAALVDAHVRGILRNPTYTGQVYAQRTRTARPRIRRSATHPIGRPHGTAVPQPAEAGSRSGRSRRVVSRGALRPGAGQAGDEPRLRPAQQHGARVPAARPGQLRLLRSGLHGPRGHQRAEPLLPLQRQGAQHLSRTARDALPGALHPGRPARRAGLARPVRAADATRSRRRRPSPGRTAAAWLPQELQARRETLRRGQAQLRQQLERLTEAYLRAVIPLDEYERRRRELEQRAQALAAQEEQLRRRRAAGRQLAGVAASLETFCERVQGGLAQADFEQRRQLVLLLIDRVIVTDGEVEIRYVLPPAPRASTSAFVICVKTTSGTLGVRSMFGACIHIRAVRCTVIRPDWRLWTC